MDLTELINIHYSCYEITPNYIGGIVYNRVSVIKTLAVTLKKQQSIHKQTDK